VCRKAIAERNVRAKDLQADEVVERHAGFVQDGAQLFHQVDDFLVDAVGHLRGAGNNAETAGEVERMVVDQNGIAERTGGIAGYVFAAHEIASRNEMDVAASHWSHASSARSH